MELARAARGVAAYYLAGISTQPPKHWKVAWTLNGTTESEPLGLYHKEGGRFGRPMPSLVPLERTGTLALTIGLAELLWNLRGYLADCTVPLRTTLEKRGMEMTDNVVTVEVRVPDDLSAISVRIAHYCDREITDPAPSVRAIIDFERTALTVGGCPLAHTHDYKVSPLKGDSHWPCGVATALWHLDLQPIWSAR